MNKIFVFFLLFLVGSMGFVAAPNTVHADSKLDILVQIAQNTKEHIKTDIDRFGSVSQEVNDMYNEGVTKTDLLLQAVENEDVASARQHFISAMIAFKQTSLAISENESQQIPLITVSELSQIINKYEDNIKKLKTISISQNADIDFQLIEQLLTLAKTNNIQGNIEQTKQSLDKIASEGKQIQKL